MKNGVGFLLGLLILAQAGCTSGNSGQANLAASASATTSCQEQIPNFMAACIREFAQVTERRTGNWTTRNAGYHLCQDGARDPIPGQKLDACYKQHGKGRFPVADLNR